MTSPYAAPIAALHAAEAAYRRAEMAIAATKAARALVGTPAQGDARAAAVDASLWARAAGEEARKQGILSAQSAIQAEGDAADAAMTAARAAYAAAIAATAAYLDACDEPA